MYKNIKIRIIDQMNWVWMRASVMQFHYDFVLRRGLFFDLLDEVTAHSSSLSSEFSEQSQPEHEHQDGERSETVTIFQSILCK